MTNIPQDTIIKVDDNTIQKLSVTTTNIDISTLKSERDYLLSALQEKAPSDQELIQAGKQAYPHIFNEITRSDMEKRIAEIDSLLKL